MFYLNSWHTLENYLLNTVLANCAKLLITYNFYVRKFYFFTVTESNDLCISFDSFVFRKLFCFITPWGSGSRFSTTSGTSTFLTTVIMPLQNLLNWRLLSCRKMKRELKFLLKIEKKILQNFWQWHKPSDPLKIS